MFCVDSLQFLYTPIPEGLRFFHTVLVHRLPPTSPSASSRHGGYPSLTM